MHRDIKPGNILISTCCPGRSVYKIADFGAARFLKANQRFGSLYGTYEYMHPDIFAKYYYKALIINPPVQLFKETHDLWSIGITLFEAATGRLPFEPRNGRADPKIMNEMINGKQCDHISAKEGEGGIEWTRELPKSCAIENKDVVTSFLAGLLKVNKFPLTVL